VPGKLILVRHGQSTWNVANLFTGWEDVELSELGRREATEAGRLIASEGLKADVAYTSVLKRAIRTLWAILDETERMWIPVERSWRLNERHYGALQGLDKAQTVAQHGEAQVQIWRRSYDIPPPPLSVDDPRHPRFDPRYAGVDPASLPAAESLKDTLTRVLPFWESRIAPQLRFGRHVLVVAHGNSLRALVKMLDDMSESDIVEFNIPTGVPIVYDFDSRSGDATPGDAELRSNGRRFLGDPAAVAAAQEAVRRQGTAAKSPVRS
jgi:2,3-bisphosphoglycerate-dependent phosphoglycerate mutase